MQPPPTDAADWAVARYTEVLAAVTAVLALVSAFQLWFLRRADVTARTAADAARQSADAAIIAQRPWLRVSGAICEPLVIDENGARLGFEVTIQNLGRSPAAQVMIYAEMVPDGYGDGLSQAVAAVRKWTDPVGATNVPVGFAIFPGETFGQKQRAVIRKEQIEACAHNTKTAPGVAIAAIYKFAGGKGLTIATYTIWRGGEPGGPQHVDLTRPITAAGYLGLNPIGIETYAE